MLTGTFMASLAEGLSLAEKAGLDQYTLLDVLNLSPIACPLVQTKGSAILEVIVCCFWLVANTVL